MVFCCDVESLQRILCHDRVCSSLCHDRARGWDGRGARMTERAIKLATELAIERGTELVTDLVTAHTTCVTSSNSAHCVWDNAHSMCDRAHNVRNRVHSVIDSVQGALCCARFGLLSIGTVHEHCSLALLKKKVQNFDPRELGCHTMHILTSHNENVVLRFNKGISYFMVVIDEIEKKPYWL